MRRWEDPGFIDEIFNSKIQPRLQELEQKRKEALSEVFKRGRGALICWVLPSVLISFLLTFYILRLELIWCLSITFFAGIISGSFAVSSTGSVSNTFEEDLRELLMNCVGEAYDDFRYERIGSSCDLKRFELCDVIPGYEKSTLEDWVQGSHNGYEFNIVEAKLTRINDKFDVTRDDYTGEQTVFWGLLISIESPLKPTSRVTIVRDQGRLRNKFNGVFARGERVEISNEQFESLYEVYADNPGKDRALFNTVFIDLFNRLPEIISADEITVVFEDGMMLVAANGAMLFLEGVTVDVNASRYKALLTNLIKDVSVAGIVIDGLQDVESSMANRVS